MTDADSFREAFADELREQILDYVRGEGIAFRGEDDADDDGEGIDEPSQSFYDAVMAPLAPLLAEIDRLRHAARLARLPRLHPGGRVSADEPSRGDDELPLDDEVVTRESDAYADIDVIAELRAWSPGQLEFVVISEPDWQRIQTAVIGAGLQGQLDGITVMPIAIDPP